MQATGGAVSGRPALRWQRRRRRHGCTLVGTVFRTQLNQGQVGDGLWGNAVRPGGRQQLRSVRKAARPSQRGSEWPGGGRAR